MSLLESGLVKSLLHMSESSVLDFKEQQYKVIKGDDDQKGEFVKDIVAFANAWKAGDAYIVIGARVNPGARAIVLGETEHPDDATFQQIVKDKVNRPVDFEYHVAQVDGAKLGIFRIKQAQERPIMLKKNYGKAKADKVYIRRSSSTDEAGFDEVARMGKASVEVAQTPQVTLELGESEENKGLGTEFTIKSTLFPYLQPRPLDVIDRAMKHLTVDPAALVQHHKDMGLLTRLEIHVHNTGRLLVNDACVSIRVPRRSGMRLLEQAPERPREPIHSIAPRIPPPRRRDSLRIYEHKDQWEIRAPLGKIQPGDGQWSEPFWLGSDRDQDLDLMAKIFGDNIAPPIEVLLKVSIRVVESDLFDLEDEEHDERARAIPVVNVQKL